MSELFLELIQKAPGFIFQIVHHAPVAETVVIGAGHIDDHFETLARLANQLLEHGRCLKAGDRAITGAFGKQNQPASGRWTGEFGDELGIVTLNVTA